MTLQFSPLCSRLDTAQKIKHDRYSSTSSGEIWKDLFVEITQKNMCDANKTYVMLDEN